MLKIAACLWDANELSPEFSRCFDNGWVDKLYRGFKRNLTIPFEFIVFVDHLRDFEEPVSQILLMRKPHDYGCLIEPFQLDGPLIVCGLDMIVLDNVDHMAKYCISGSKPALLQHPSKPTYGFINPVAFVPAGHRRIYNDWRGENDMEWLRKQDMVDAETMWPGQILSYKLHDLRRREHLIAKAKIVYFHGSKKPHELLHLHAWMQQHWR